MAYVPVPKDLSKIKTKLAFNLTKRQLVCFSSAAAVGLPAYLFSRGSIGNSAAMFLMIGLMLPFFFLAMYERLDRIHVSGGKFLTEAINIRHAQSLAENVDCRQMDKTSSLPPGTGICLHFRTMTARLSNRKA